MTEERELVWHKILETDESTRRTCHVLRLANTSRCA